MSPISATVLASPIHVPPSSANLDRELHAYVAGVLLQWEPFIFVLGIPIGVMAKMR